LIVDLKKDPEKKYEYTDRQTDLILKGQRRGSGK